MDKKSLGMRIKAARKERNLTSEKLSEMCNINATYLRQIEGGTKTPSLPMFITICEQLKVSPNYLLQDMISDAGYNTFDELIQLLKIASPTQMKLITAMIKSALENIEN